MAAMRDRLDAPMLVGVGAAFDFHAGLVPQAPAWMQSVGPGVGVPPRAGAAPPVAALRCATTRASSRASRAQFARAVVRAAATLASRPWTATSPSSASGRVGLPLALSFADRGLSVARRRHRPERLAAVARRPHAVRGDRRRRRSLDRVHASGRLEVSDRVADAARAEHIVITLGTPSFSHIEIDMPRHPLGARRPARRTCARATRSSCARRSRRARPTSSPATSPSTAASQIGEDVFVAHAPERIAAGRFFEEIDTLPCIVGGVGERSGERVRASCSTSSTRRSCRRRPSRPSSRRSGRTSCATRRSRCPTS